MKNKEEKDRRVKPNSMFHRLIKLPILQGINLENLEEVLAEVPLRFKTFLPNKILFKQGDTCNGITFILHGKFKVTHTERGERYSIIEEFENDFTIEPTSMFGLKSRYFSTYESQTEVHTLTIAKLDFLALLSKFTIIQMNVFNMMNARTQLVQTRNWLVSPTDIRQRLVHFAMCRLEKPEGAKTLLISFRTLGKVLNSSHVTIALILKEFEKQGLVQLSSRMIHIPDMNKLYIETMDMRHKE